MLSFYLFEVSILAIHVRNIICSIQFPILSGHELEVEITVFVYPKLEGSFHVHVRDQCLDLRISLSSEVVISDIYSLNLQVADKVGIYI